MTRGPLTKAEAAAYREGGFRLEGEPLTLEQAARHQLAAARQLLKLWGADAAAVRATLAAPSAYRLRRWQRGQAPIPWETGERAVIVLALYRRLVEGIDFVSVRALPALRRPGRRALPARALLAAGKLSDLLALWRQLVLDEEAAAEETAAGAAPPRARRS